MWGRRATTWGWEGARGAPGGDSAETACEPEPGGPEGNSAGRSLAGRERRPGRAASGRRRISQPQVSKVARNPTMGRWTRRGRRVAGAAEGRSPRREPRLSIGARLRGRGFSELRRGVTAKEAARDTPERPADGAPGPAVSVAAAAAAPALRGRSPPHQTDATCSVARSPALVTRRRNVGGGRVAGCGASLLRGVTSMPVRKAEKGAAPTGARRVRRTRPRQLRAGCRRSRRPVRGRPSPESAAVSPFWAEMMRF